MELISSLIILIAGYIAFMFLFNVIIVPVFTIIAIAVLYILHILHIIRIQ